MSRQEQLSGNDLAVGGQAVLEGVMMLGKTTCAVSVLRPDGKIVQKITLRKKKQGFSKFLRELPFVRGIFNLFDTLIIGIKALNYSADIAIKYEEEQEVSKNSKPKKIKAKNDTNLFTSLIMGISFAFSMLLALFLFKFLPYFVSSKIGASSGSSSFVFIEGIIKLGIFILYILIISLNKDIRRVFEFHGAEHKSIHCFEKHGNSKKLNPKEASKFTRIHKRCGTTFLFLVIIVSILIYSFIPLNYTFWISFMIRILSLPIIAGISYEILKLASKLSKKNPLYWVLYVLELPGLLIQRLTTREPNLKQLEVAIKSLKRVL